MCVCLKGLGMVGFDFDHVASTRVWFLHSSLELLCAF